MVSDSDLPLGGGEVGRTERKIQGLNIKIDAQEFKYKKHFSWLILGGGIVYLYLIVS